MCTRRFILGLLTLATLGNQAVAEELLWFKADYLTWNGEAVEPGRAHFSSGTGALPEGSKKIASVTLASQPGRATSTQSALKNGKFFALVRWHQDAGGVVEFQFEAQIHHEKQLPEDIDTIVTVRLKPGQQFWFRGWNNVDRGLRVSVEEPE